MNAATREGCAFCKIGRHELPTVVVEEDEDVLAIMDLYPASTGHILVMPKLHIEDIYSMPPDLGARIMVMALAVARAIKETLSPIGLNLLQSNGVEAGQTIPHFHLHIVPRYLHDSVFLRFGHGNVPAQIDELERTASLIRSALESK
jgi:histidine triad (HIT) family protein